MTTRKAPPAKIQQSEQEELTTSSGRVLKVSKLTFIEQFRLSSILGADDVANEVTQTIGLMAAMVRSIDGTPWRFPETRANLEQAIVRLDQDGAEAVAGFIREMAEAESPEKEADDAGN